MLKLSNELASTTAQTLYQELQSSDEAWCAQHDYITGETKYCERIEALCGVRPLIWGNDFGFRYIGSNPKKIRHCGPMNLSEPGSDEAVLEHDAEAMRSDLVMRCMQQHQRGNVITLMWHCPPPQLGDDCRHHELWTMDQRPDQSWWDELCTEGTALHEQWCTQVDRIAAHLKILCDNNIPVLWRPYHEMNGIWFWWCNKPGTNGYQRLWRNLYERFTKHHELNNLIWVWNTNAPRDKAGDEAYPYADFYPGHDVVDVLAADVYHNDYQLSHHDELVELGAGKPIALGEVGHLPTQAILAQQNQWRWIMPWGFLLEKINDESAIKEWVEHSRCLK